MSSAKWQPFCLGLNVFSETLYFVSTGPGNDLHGADKAAGLSQPKDDGV